MTGLSWTPPGPGSWESDRSHLERPVSGYFASIYKEPYERGFRECFALYGALLEVIELEVVNGFLYTSLRPFGAPPDAKGPPPRFVFKLLQWLHPGMRKRLRAAEETFASRRWRAEADMFRNEWMPLMVRAHLALQQVEPATLSDGELAEHLRACHEALLTAIYRHHRMACAMALPVGDFAAQVHEWTAAPLHEVMELLRGSSPSSLAGSDQLAELAAAVRADPSRREQLAAAEDADAAALLDQLEAAEGDVGTAARAWLEEVGLRVITGFDVSDRAAREMPDMLVKALRATVEGREHAAVDRVAERTAAMRARVPARERETFDALLDDARYVYGIRDDRNELNDAWATGLMRRVILEVGRRLTDKGKLHDAEHACELCIDEQLALLDGGSGPSADDCAEQARYRETSTSDDAPLLLGPEPSPPPPLRWLPPAAARMQRAVMVYVDGMFKDADPDEAPNGAVVTGHPAAPGKYVGTARLVLAPDDFGKVQEGDVLVARMTTPSYNVLLPLLGGVVTDRGGVLSHPAIVAREYGIPGVVGCREATTLIPNGARVEIDGEVGSVRVLS